MKTMTRKEMLKLKKVCDSIRKTNRMKGKNCHTPKLVDASTQKLSEFFYKNKDKIEREVNAMIRSRYSKYKYEGSIFENASFNDGQNYGRFIVAFKGYTFYTDKNKIAKDVLDIIAKSVNGSVISVNAYDVDKQFINSGRLDDTFELWIQGKITYDKSKFSA